MCEILVDLFLLGALLKLELLIYYCLGLVYWLIGVAIGIRIGYGTVCWYMHEWYMHGIGIWC